MKISAKSEYAVRAAVLIAAADGTRIKAEELATTANIPRQFLENILGELRRAGIVRAQRGADGGYELALPADDVDLAMVLAAVGSPLADGDQPSDDGNGVVLDEVWVALQSATRGLLERVTLAHLVNGSLPDTVRDLVARERARLGD
jgi:Rrf2 family protein